jgi:acyl-homoserine lactone acylase PvdQ
MLVDFAQPDRLLAVQNIGNSGQPGSPHYSDQFEAWIAGTYHTVALRREDVERDLEGTTILDPSA